MTANAATLAHGMVAPMPSAERVDALLPQTQCTRCGYPSCREYAGPENGRWLAVEDLARVAPAIVDITRLYKNRDARIDSMVEAGRLTARQYGLDRMERELLQFWEEETGFCR